MCEYPCLGPVIKEKFRYLTLILLDCWQREYDKRPYRCFKFERLMFEERFERKYHFIKDFPVIVQFLQKRYLNSMKLVGLDVTTYMLQTLYDFVESLKRFKFIELKLMNLPTTFYEVMANNVDHMKLTELSLEGTPLTDNDIVFLRLYVIKSLKLESLNVNSCSITQYNFADIADGVYKSLKVHTFKASYLLGLHLHLDSQKVAHTVASLLWQNKLQTLELENCGFQAEDMELLAEYLYNKDCKLVSLNLAYNKIGANGALELLKAIACSSTLKHLNLNGCGLGSHGGEIVAHYLSSCWNLESLMLQYNNIKAEIVTMILLCMKKSCKLFKLHLYGNSYNPRTGKILRRLLESRVLPQDYIDITFTYDDTIPGYRVIPWRP